MIIVNQKPAAADDVQVGQMLGRYMLLRPLGEGGMGTVFAAYDPLMSRSVAVKFIRPNSTSNPVEDAQMQARFVREARTLARLSHPNIVAIYDVGVDAERVYMAMELVEGETLAGWLRKCKKDRQWRPKVEVMLQAGDGLAVAHAAGLVHRDIKPANLLVGADGLTRVADFGIAGEAQTPIEPITKSKPDGYTSGAFSITASDSRLTSCGAVVGTPLYMSPEQRRGENVDARSDQFSYCLVLFEALYGSLPHVKSRFSSQAHACCEGHDELPKWRRPLGHPDWLDEVLARGLKGDPQERFATLQELLAAIRERMRSRRERVLATTVTVGLAASLGLAAFGQSLQATGPPERCTSGAGRWSTVWDEEQATELEAKMLSKDTPALRNAWGSVRQTLDAYRQAWTERYQDFCGAQHERALDLQVACLDRALSHVSGLLASWHATAKPSPMQALQHAQAIPDLATCDDVKALRLAVPLPEDAEQRAHILSLRDKLARMKGASCTRSGEQQREVTELWTQAQAIGDLALLADLYGYDMDCYQEDANYRSALAAAVKGSVLAAAAGHGHAMAYISTRLNFVRAYLMADLSDVDDEMGAAQAAVRAVHYPWESAFLLDTVTAIVRGNQGRAHESVELFQRLFHSAEKHNDMLRMVESMSNLGVTYFRLNRFEEAYDAELRALNLGRGRGRADDPLTIYRYSNLSLYLSKLGRYEEALMYGNLAVDLQGQFWSPLAAARDKLFVANVLGQLKRYEEALVILVEVEQIQTQNGRRGHPLAQWAQVQAAEMLLQLGKIAAAREAAQHGLHLTKEDPSADPGLRAHALAVCAAVGLAQGELSAAQRWLAQAREFALQGTNDLELIEVDVLRARLAVARGEWHDAQALAGDALRRQIAILGASHPSVEQIRMLFEQTKREYSTHKLSEAEKMP